VSSDSHTRQPSTSSTFPRRLVLPETSVGPGVGPVSAIESSILPFLSSRASTALAVGANQSRSPPPSYVSCPSFVGIIASPLPVSSTKSGSVVLLEISIPVSDTIPTLNLSPAASTRSQGVAVSPGCSKSPGSTNPTTIPGTKVSAIRRRRQTSEQGALKGEGDEDASESKKIGSTVSTVPTSGTFDTSIIVFTEHWWTMTIT